MSTHVAVQRAGMSPIRGIEEAYQFRTLITLLLDFIAFLFFLSSVMCSGLLIVSLILWNCSYVYLHSQKRICTFGVYLQPTQNNVLGRRLLFLSRHQKFVPLCTAVLQQIGAFPFFIFLVKYEFATIIQWQCNFRPLLTALLTHGNARKFVKSVTLVKSWNS